MLPDQPFILWCSIEYISQHNIHCHKFPIVLLV